MSDPTSPLTATDPASLDHYFLTDPMHLSIADIETRLIPELIRRRNAFTAEEAAKALAPKKTRAKVGEVTPSTSITADKPASELSLDDFT